MITAHSYQLISKTSLNRLNASKYQSGFLIKVSENACSAYADYFPWKVFGDLSCKQAMKAIKEGNLNNHLLAAFEKIKIELKAKGAQRSLFSKDLSIPMQFTLTEANFNTFNKAYQQGFKTFKVKMDDSKEKVAFLEKIKGFKVTLRLDFNLLFQDAAAAIKYIHSLSDDLLDKIEYFEDLLPLRLYPFFKEEFPHIKLALDQELTLTNYEQADFVVLKPAKFSLEQARLIEKPLILSSYMDHPIGILWAGYYYQELKLSNPAGLYTFPLYQKTPFHSLFKVTQANLRFNITGHGLGADHLLETLTWNNL